MSQHATYTNVTRMLPKKDMCSILMATEKTNAALPHLDSFGDTALMEYPNDTSFDFGLSNWDIVAPTLPARAVGAFRFRNKSS